MKKVMLLIIYESNHKATQGIKRILDDTIIHIILSVLQKYITLL